MQLTDFALLAFLAWVVQFHLIQRRQAQLMARFVAPQVAELVRQRGLKCAVESRTMEISVVCCDLRGFTAYCESVPSQKVIRMLREYYAAVGAAAEAFGGTIKDQAGDGVLILVGAPVPYQDHAQRALLLAKRIRASGVALAARWSDAESSLGVGIGVASGRVTVGVIGAASRLEYTAIGPAVNLASRLCSQAAHGGLLLDQRSVELLDAGTRGRDLRSAGALQLKGIRLPVVSYALAAP